MMAENKKSIYFVISAMGGGGAEKVLSLILNYLDREKFSPRLILFKKEGEYLGSIPSDVEITNLNKKSKWDFLKLLFRLRQIIKKENPDIIISFMHYTNIITVLSNLALKNRPKVIISERNYHRMYLPCARAKVLRRALLYFTYRRAFKIIAISEGIKKAIVEDIKVDESEVKVIHNPIDIKKILTLKEENVSHKFFRNDKKLPVLISVGRLEKEKNFPLLIRAFAIVRENRPAYLIVVGQGKLRNDLNALVRQLGLEGCVDFVGFQKNPFTWMEKADLFVLPSMWEGFGNVIIEAMACGTPVISTNCPVGPGEIIENWKNGALVKTNDAFEMSKAISELLGNEALRNKIREGAFRNIDRFDIKKIISQYEKVFIEAEI